MKKKTFLFSALVLLISILSIMPMYAREGNRRCGLAQTCCDIGFLAELAERDFDPDVLLEERASYLNGLVTAGYITQARANEILECFTAMIDYRVATGVWRCQRVGGLQCPRIDESLCQRADRHMNNGGSRQGGCRRRNGN